MDKLLDEIKFANNHYAPFYNELGINKIMFSKYHRPCKCWDWRQHAAIKMGDLKGKYLLDYGCGMGEEAIYFAKLGATVTAIDISPVGIDITKKRAIYNGLSGQINAYVGDVTKTVLPSDSFDIVHGIGILHHVGIKEGLYEVKRLLKKGGIGVFLEPMSNSKFIDRLKLLVYGGKQNMDYTDHERPLSISEIIKYNEYFSESMIYPYHLIYRIRRFFPKIIGEKALIVDYYILKIFPFLKIWAGGVLVFIRK
jgi:ubiquinone/menaquinone biosynthesis C-methylase UbiE